jgi:pyruvate kinase
MNTPSRAQIIATLGPTSSNIDTIRDLVQAGVDVFRLNFSWGAFSEHKQRISDIRSIEIELSRSLIILADLPGPRIQESATHTYNKAAVSAITDHDRECIRFAVEQGIDCIAVSFVGTATDIDDCKVCIKECGGTQMVIAKIERQTALDNLDSILSVADGVMVARGDLADEISIERVPLAQLDIIRGANNAHKSVIVATQMMVSMVDHDMPTRAEATDVEMALIEGSDAVMLSEETARGMHPVEVVCMMEKMLVVAETRRTRKEFCLLKKLS